MTWVEYWAFCRLELGMSQVEYQQLAPRNILALAVRRGQQRDEKDYRSGVMICNLLAPYVEKGKQGPQPWTFFPNLEKYRFKTKRKR